MNKILNNPLKLIVAWLLVSAITTFFLVVVKSIGTSDGEQWPLRIIAKALIIIPSGGLILSFISPFLFASWSKRYWYLIAVFILLFALPILIYFS